MITRPDYPSYGNWLKRGATTLWENFDKDWVDSPNHHFWGDISAWFVKALAGINYNPTGTDLRDVLISPHFAEQLEYAEGYYDSPIGKIVSSWKRDGEKITLNIKSTEEMNVTIKLSDGYAFEDGNTQKTSLSDCETFVVMKK